MVQYYITVPFDIEKIQEMLIMPKEYNGKIYTEGAPHDINEFLEIIKILRSEEGCPWDRAQTHESLKKCLTDETEEVLAAIDNNDKENLCEELGDILLQFVMHAQIGAENGEFTFQDIVQMVSDKMIRRHPHVFGDMKRPETPEEGLEMWREVKRREKER